MQGHPTPERHGNTLDSLSTIVHFLEAKRGLGVSPGHHRRVVAFAVAIGEQMELFPEDLYRLEVAGSFHDLGLVAAPEALLHKEGPLSPEEYELVKRHPDDSVRILRPSISDPDILAAVRHHHEFYDGSGYPAALAADEIPLLARILAVVEVFDSVTNDRPWRNALSVERSRELLRDGAGICFDPHVVSAFLELPEEVVFRLMRLV